MNMPRYDGESILCRWRNNVIGNPVAYTGTTDFALEKTLTEVRIQEEMPVKNVTVSEERPFWISDRILRELSRFTQSFLKVRR